MKMLNGAELASYIKPRQAKQIRALRQSKAIEPRLAIIVTKDDPVIDTYVRLKQQYGQDILVDVEVCRISQDKIFEKFVQIDTYGSSERAIPGKVSQSLRLSKSAFDELSKLAASHF